MDYYCFYMSPLGEMHLECNETELTGCWFSGQKYEHNLNGIEQPSNPILLEAKQWLNSYFSGNKSTISFNLQPKGSEFRQTVWKKLQKIPYGQVITYSEIAKEICEELGREAMSAQAIGGAVGHNPISIFIPCHRVIGSNGELTGYAGGIERKRALLLLEKLEIENIKTASGQVYSVKKDL